MGTDAQFYLRTKQPLTGEQIMATEHEFIRRFGPSCIVGYALFLHRQDHNDFGDRLTYKVDIDAGRHFSPEHGGRGQGHLYGCYILTLLHLFPDAIVYYNGDQTGGPTTEATREIAFKLIDLYCKEGEDS